MGGERQQWSCIVICVGYCSKKKKKEKSQCVVTCSDVIYFEDLEGLALLSKVAFQSFFLAQLCVGNSAWPEETAANSDH